MSPVTLEGKFIYRESCGAKLSWDEPLPSELAKTWSKWEKGLPRAVSFPRSLPSFREPIEEVKIHSFGDASKKGLCAAVYVVIQQESGVSQRLVTAKSRIAKPNLTIPRLELVAGHMAINLAVNVKNALEGFNVAEKIHCWLDSTVALHWLNDDGEYRQFVTNRVRKIKSHPNVSWHHVPTAQNPADLGSRGGSVNAANLWWNGPDWLSDETKWPPKIVTKASDVSDAERKVQREVSAVGVEMNAFLGGIPLKLLRFRSRTVRCNSHDIAPISVQNERPNYMSAKLFADTHCKYSEFKRLFTCSFGPILNKCGAKSATILRMRSVTYRFRTTSVAYSCRSEKRNDGSVLCEGNVYPLQGRGCNDMVPVQCKRSLQHCMTALMFAGGFRNPVTLKFLTDTRFSVIYKNLGSVYIKPWYIYCTHRVSFNCCLTYSILFYTPWVCVCVLLLKFVLRHLCMC